MLLILVSSCFKNCAFASARVFKGQCMLMWASCIVYEFTDVLHDHHAWSQNRNGKRNRFKLNAYVAECVSGYCTCDEHATLYKITWMKAKLWWGMRCFHVALALHEIAALQWSWIPEESFIDEAFTYIDNHTFKSAMFVEITNSRYYTENLSYLMNFPNDLVASSSCSLLIEVFCLMKW